MVDSVKVRYHEQETTRLLRELSDLKRIIAQLENEISRLKDEATLQLLRHKEDAKYMREKFDEDVRVIEK